MAFMLDPKKFSDFPPEPTVDGSEIIPIVKDGQNSSVTVETLQQLVDVITDHGQLGGLSDDDHPQYALADGSRGDFATTGQGALADTALQNISGQDLSTADNTASAFITAADVPAETDPVFAASSAASITPTDITHLANLDSAAYEPSTAFAPALGVDDNYVTDAEKSNLHTHSNKTVLDNTTASFTTADETKLDGIAAGAQVNTVTSVNTRTGAVTGLAEASDLTAHTGNTSNPHSVTKAQVGLGNADNTSDAAKPISTATQTALDGKFTQRTITGTTNQVTVTNGDGVSGNPTLSLPQDIHTGASPSFNTVTASLTGAASLNVLKTGGTMSGALAINATTPLVLNTSDLVVTKNGTGIAIGVGTATPTGNTNRAVFWLNDTGAGSEFKMYNSTVQARLYNNGSSTMGFGTDSNHSIAFFTNGGANVRLIINNTGSIGASGTIYPTTTGTYKLGDTTVYWSNVYATRHYLNSTAYADGATAGQFKITGLLMPVQATTAGAPAYVKGAIYFDTTLNKLCVGGATAWETITST
jgi:hypothetical protein